MISLENHTNSNFSAEEVRSYICYTRLFLEEVFQYPHDKVVVNLFIKNISDALYPEIGGCTIQNSFTEYDVILFNNPHRIVGIISHELIHVKQFMENGFRIDRLKNKVFWKTKFFMSYTELLKIHREKDIQKYKLLPWEFEAETMIPAIVGKISGKFNKVYNDGELDTLLKTATSESKFY